MGEHDIPASNFKLFVNTADGEFREHIGPTGGGFIGDYHNDITDITGAIIGHDGTLYGQDENFYLTASYSTMPFNPNEEEGSFPNDGLYFFQEWYWPYMTMNDQGFLIDYRFGLRVSGLSSRDPVNPGPLDDSEPRHQRIGVDDNTGVYLTDTPPGHASFDWAEFFYILDNSQELHMMIVEFNYPYDVIYVGKAGPETWTGTAVDVEVAPGFTYTSWSPWGWSEVLIDKLDGTWTVMTLLWDFTEEPPVIHVIDETDPLPGIPQAIDVDNTDFELHVIADVDGTMEATVFYWYDNMGGGD